MDTIKLNHIIDPMLILVQYIYDLHIRNVRISGIHGIEDFYIEGEYIVTMGSNISEIMKHQDVKGEYLITNNLREIFEFFGIDSVCSAIKKEWLGVMNDNDTNINSRHVALIADAMCHQGIPLPMNYKGICSNSSVMTRASFEKAMDSFLKGGLTGQCDNMHGIMDAITWNNLILSGTGGIELIEEKYTLHPFLKDSYYRMKDELLYQANLKFNSIRKRRNLTNDPVQQTQSLFHSCPIDETGSKAISNPSDSNHHHERNIYKRQMLELPSNIDNIDNITNRKHMNIRILQSSTKEYNII